MPVLNSLRLLPMPETKEKLTKLFESAPIAFDVDSLYLTVMETKTDMTEEHAEAWATMPPVLVKFGTLTTAYDSSAGNSRLILPIESEELVDIFGGLQRFGYEPFWTPEPVFYTVLLDNVSTFKRRRWGWLSTVSTSLFNMTDLAFGYGHIVARNSDYMENAEYVRMAIEGS